MFAETEINLVNGLAALALGFGLLVLVAWVDRRYLQKYEEVQAAEEEAKSKAEKPLLDEAVTEENDAVSGAVAVVSSRTADSLPWKPGSDAPTTAEPLPTMLPARNVGETETKTDDEGDDEAGEQPAATTQTAEPPAKDTSTATTTDTAAGDEGAAVVAETAVAGPSSPDPDPVDAKPTKTAAATAAEPDPAEASPHATKATKAPPSEPSTTVEPPRAAVDDDTGNGLDWDVPTIVRSPRPSAAPADAASADAAPAEAGTETGAVRSEPDPVSEPSIDLRREGPLPGRRAAARSPRVTRGDERTPNDASPVADEREIPTGLPKGAEAALASILEVVPDPRNTIALTRDPTAEVRLTKADRDQAITSSGQPRATYEPPAPNDDEWETPKEPAASDRLAATPDHAHHVHHP